MNTQTGENQINKKEKNTSSTDHVKTSDKKTKPEISNSFLQRILSLLKKEELI